MRSQNFFRATYVMVLLVSFISTNQPAHASASAFDKLDVQINERNSPDFQDILQVQPSISLAITPQIITLGEMATVSVKLNNVPVEGYTGIEITCTYYPDLIEARDIVVADLFGADPVVAIRGPQSDHFIVAIAGSRGNKATKDGTVMTFHIKGLQRGIFPLECQARVSTGNHALADITAISNDILVLGPTSTSTTGLCDSAEFIADINVPPGTVMAPGAQFKKTWRLMNVGTCTWTNSYQLVFFSGEQMGALLSFNFPVSVSPGQAIDLSLDMTAPLLAGSYTSNWMFKNANGALFGIGPQANQPFSVNIVVSGSTVTPGTPPNSPTPSITPGGPTATPIADVAFDFAANVCTALWFSGAGQLPCPGNEGDPNGFVLKLNNPILETGVTETRPGILTFPQNVQNGYIQGFYPPFHVQDGDRFRSSIGCESGATSCYVAFRLDYQVGADPVKTFWGPFLERYDGRSFSVDIDLSPLAGKDVRFILTLLSAGSATGDRALWVAPHISRAGAGSTLTPDPLTSTPTETPTPTLTPTPVLTTTPVFTVTPFNSPTSDPQVFGTLTGQVLADKQVNISLLDTNQRLVVSVDADINGTYSITAPAGGTYTVIATAQGYLSARGFATITTNTTTTMPRITLLAGDIDGNNVIDQFDALTIGMSYNTAAPSEADLNNDGIINVLDLEMLAQHYRKTGPVLWE